MTSAMEAGFPELHVQMKLNIQTDGPGEIQYTTGIHTGAAAAYYAHGGGFPVPSLNYNPVPAINGTVPATTGSSTPTPKIQPITSSVDDLAGKSSRQSGSRHYQRSTTSSRHSHHRHGGSSRASSRRSSKDKHGKTNAIAEASDASTTTTDDFACSEITTSSTTPTPMDEIVPERLSYNEDLVRPPPPPDYDDIVLRHQRQVDDVVLIRQREAEEAMIMRQRQEVMYTREAEGASAAAASRTHVTTPGGTSGYAGSSTGVSMASQAQPQLGGSDQNLSRFIGNVFSQPPPLQQPYSSRFQHYVQQQQQSGRSSRVSQLQPRVVNYEASPILRSKSQTSIDRVVTEFPVNEPQRHGSSRSIANRHGGSSRSIKEQTREELERQLGPLLTGLERRIANMIGERDASALAAVQASLATRASSSASTRRTAPPHDGSRCSSRHSSTRTVQETTFPVEEGEEIDRKWKSQSSLTERSSLIDRGSDAIYFRQQREKVSDFPVHQDAAVSTDRPSLVDSSTDANLRAVQETVTDFPAKHDSSVGTDLPRMTEAATVTTDSLERPLKILSKEPRPAPRPAPIPAPRPAPPNILPPDDDFPPPPPPPVLPRVVPSTRVPLHSRPDTLPPDPPSRPVIPPPNPPNDDETSELFRAMINEIKEKGHQRCQRAVTPQSMRLNASSSSIFEIYTSATTTTAKLPSPNYPHLEHVAISSVTDSIDREGSDISDVMKRPALRNPGGVRLFTRKDHGRTDTLSSNNTTGTLREEDLAEYADIISPRMVPQRADSETMSNTESIMSETSLKTDRPKEFYDAAVSRPPPRLIFTNGADKNIVMKQKFLADHLAILQPESDNDFPPPPPPISRFETTETFEEETIEEIEKHTDEYFLPNARRPSLEGIETETAADDHPRRPGVLPLLSPPSRPQTFTPRRSDSRQSSQSVFVSPSDCESRVSLTRTAQVVTRHDQATQQRVQGSQRPTEL